MISIAYRKDRYSPHISVILKAIMTINRTAYDTTFGLALKPMLAKTIHAIKESVIKDNLNLYQENIVNEDVPAFVVKGRYQSEDNIPFFSHPLEIELRDMATKQDRPHIVTDVRQLVTKQFNRGDGLESDFRIRNYADYMFNISRTTMNTLWLSHPPAMLRDMSHIPCAMYAAWIAEAVARRYALNPAETLGISIIAAIYYQSQFTKNDWFEEDELPKVAQAVARATNARAQQVFDYLDKIESMTSVGDMCRACHAILENPRLQDFNEAILITIVGNTIFMTNNKEVAAVALEHPPTWIVLSFYSFTERSYKNSTIAKIATRYLGHKGESDFVKAFTSVLHQAYVEPAAG